MTEQQILKLLDAGEHEHLECKAAAHGVPKSMWDTYSAFANTAGGVILLGVEEDGAAGGNRYSIAGVQNAGAKIKEIWDTVNNKSKVSRNILSGSDVGVTRISEADVIWMRVPAVSFAERPIHRGENPYAGTFKRNHDGDYRCTEEEVRAMERDRIPNRDLEIMPDSTLDDLDTAAIAAYRTQFRVLRVGHSWNALPDEDFLYRLGVWKEDHHFNKRLTTAGMLMFGKGDALHDRFPAISLDYIDKRRVVPGSRWRDRITYDGTWEYNLFNFVTQVMPRIIDDLPTPFQLNGVIREDETPVHSAVREALINMIVHCDYRAAGTVRAIKDDDGFSFRNPGAPLVPVSDIYAGGTTITRNPQIQIMFRLIGYGESVGSGFTLIVDTWKHQNWRLPDLSANESVRATDLRLWMLPITSDEIDKEAVRVVDGYKDLSSSARQAVSILLTEHSASTERIARVLSRTREETLIFLTQLADRRVVKRNESGRWELEQYREPLTVSPKNRNTAKHLDEQILALLAKHDSMSTQQLADATGYGKRRIQASLRSLLDAGTIARSRTGNAVAYSVSTRQTVAAVDGKVGYIPETE